MCAPSKNKTNKNKHCKNHRNRNIHYYYLQNKSVIGPTSFKNTREAITKLSWIIPVLVTDYMTTGFIFIDKIFTFKAAQRIYIYPTLLKS